MSATPLTRIVRWDERYEPFFLPPSKTIPVISFPVEISEPEFASGYMKLIGQKKGAAYLGGWIAILQVAARRFPRGVLITPRGTAYDSLALSRDSRLPSKLFDELIPFLINEIAWLQPVSQNEVAEIIENCRQAAVRAVRTRLDDANTKASGSARTRRVRGA